METYEFYARCAGGMEGLLADELREFGIPRIRPLKGGVAFFGTLAHAYRACLWSRTATRVLLVLARVEAPDAEALYSGVRTLDWRDHLTPGATFAVSSQGTNEALRNSQFTSLRVKDAVCDQMRERCGVRPEVDARRPSVRIDAALRGNRATLSLDLAGEALHRRGYRQDKVQAGAPLKETLAAAVLLAGGWKDTARAGGAFIDPMCGSGTLVVEAAMIAADRAPGLLRSYWGFSGWAGHDPVLWEELLDEADGRAVRGQEEAGVFAGCDTDVGSIEIARACARRAGLSANTRFEVCGAARIGTVFADVAKAGTSGLVAVNPPYGERMASAAQLPALYAALAEGTASLPHGWDLAVITPDAQIDTALGLTPCQTLPLFNGRIETDLRRYVLGETGRITVGISPLTGERELMVAVAEKNSGQFAARLRKVAKERMKWARKNGIGALRIYDADLPDYAVAVDVFEGWQPSGGAGARLAAKGEGGGVRRFARIAEYQAPAGVDAQRAQRRYRDVLALVPAVLGIDASCIFEKTRRHGKGGEQYREARAKPCVVEVRESGYCFELDLNGYLDTGLFLDHRLTRALLGSMAAGKRFLNLFAYTGAASVYAAGGGAVSTIAVDLSNTYLSWAGRNLARNGFSGAQHQIVRADVSRWITEARAQGLRFDLVFVDPPTFSNSKAMGRATWSVQRDHAELLIGVSRLLAPGGTAVFSCNLRSFAPDFATLARYGVVLEDITASTIPEDFARNPKIHSCFLVRRQARG